MKKIIRSILSIASIAILISCQQQKAEKSDWKPLFNEETLQGLHIYNKGNAESKWKAVDGELLCDPKAEGIFGDIITDQEYENFELKFDWKVNKGGNSGVLINVSEDSSYAATFATGLEMQLLDNTNAEARHQVDSTHWAGCLYSVECIASESKPNPYEQWNNAKVKLDNGELTFWVNDRITYQGNIHSKAFQDKVANSNMKNYPAFGTFKKGKIAFQNHTDSVRFKNIRIKDLS